MNYQDYFIIEYGLPIAGFIITILAQLFVNGNYKKYKNEKSNKDITGAEVAREILDKHDLQEIKVVKTTGTLTDHYDPTKKVIRLSTDIYESSTIAAVSVAAHECGHAIQDKERYIPLRIRSSIVPFVNFSTKIGYLVIMIGLIFNAIDLAMFGLILLMAMLAFQLITLPVEFNASNRAKKELATLNILNEKEQSGSKKMLTAAALTYVASLMTTLLQILRMALIVFSRHDDR